tara:strand:+ start:1157 stop:4039 length:2883 start_codon:yes stop_codon:yes gene_type:complete
MVSRKAFLALVLPSLQEGECYCTFGIKHVDDKPVIKQRFVTSLDAIDSNADLLVAEQYNAFFAMAKYGDQGAGRTAANAVALKSFYIDLDCGPNKPYAELSDGINALKQFCKQTGLPRPTIVKSGSGAHLYWAMKGTLPRSEWRPYAEQLKALCVQYKFDVDPAVTAEAARVLRIPGTYHVKDPTNPILVEVLYVAPEIEHSEIARILTPNVDILHNLSKANLRRPLDPTTLALIGSSQSSFKKLLVKSIEGAGCAQIAYIYDNQPTVPEPLWRAGLSIAQHCGDRDKAIHVISKKHPEYNAHDTERKANETKGPYTCETFKKLNSAGCEGCPLKITSPIQLGREILEATEDDNTVVDLEPETKEAKTYVIPKYPFPFFRGKAGGIFVHTRRKKGKGDEIEEEDVDELVYPYDFYVAKRMHDPDLGETILLRLHLPKDGVREFIMPLGNSMSKDKFISTVAQYGMTALGKKQDYLMEYVTKSVENLQLSARADKAHRQFGWLEDESGIIIGDREVRATETVYSPPSAPTLPNIPLFQAKGDFHVWKDVVSAYGRPGMEYRAFAFFMGFGTMLMRFTALDGFLLNLVSRESGSGKTTILEVINSIYGRPRELLLAPKDTYNSRMQRLGVMQNFAVTMDEITNMAPDQLSQQVYDVTSGRAKNRLKQHDNAERTNTTKWQTGMITTSNQRITDALISLKGFPDGELKRIMEINVRPDPYDDATWARAHFGRLSTNYGHAIEPFSRALISQLPMVKQKLAEVQLRVDQAAGIRNSERYWALMASVALAGGAIAKHLGLHDIEIKPVFKYAVGLIEESRDKSRQYMFDENEFLGRFLQDHFHEILVINGSKDKRTGIEHGPIKEPRGRLVARYEPDTKLLYIMKASYQDACFKVRINLDESLIPYKKTGGYIKTHKKRMLAGTSASASTNVTALWFDTTKLGFFDEAVLIENESIRPAPADPVG